MNDHEKYRGMVRLLGQQLADQMWAAKDTAFARDPRAARLVEQQLQTCAAKHAPEVWQVCASKGVPAALGTIARFKAMDATAIDTALEAVRVAYDSGDRAAIGQALQDLVALCEQATAPTGTAGSRTTDTTPRAPATGKAARTFDVLMANVSAHLTKTGGH